MNLLKWFLPILMPSWNFFDRIGATIRLEYSLDGSQWFIVEIPKPRTLVGASIVLIINPWRNEHLYQMSLAERLTTAPDQHDEKILRDRLQKRFHLNRTPRFRVWSDNELAFQSQVPA